MPERGTVDAEFILRSLAEKLGAKNIKLFFIFADLEKAFGLVTTEVIRFALTRKSVPKYLVNGIMCLYKGCKTAASVDGELPRSFSEKIGVYQRSALSPLLFIMVYLSLL